MSESQPTHKVVYNGREMYQDAKGILHEGFYQVVPVDQESRYEVEGKRGTSEECQAYANQLNEGDFSALGESLRFPFGKDDEI